MIGRFDHLDQFAEGVFHIAMNGQLHVFVLVVLGAVEINVHDGAGLAEFLHLAGHAVIKPHAKGEQESAPSAILRVLPLASLRSSPLTAQFA